MSQFNVYSISVEDIIGWVKSGEVAIPEIQRPFVWSNAKVRDLMDSLYKGFPIGYIIVWKNPDVKLKDGSLSSGKKILIDGQQRVTAVGEADRCPVGDRELHGHHRRDAGHHHGRGNPEFIGTQGADNDDKA